MTKKLKDFVKKNPEPARGKVGVDPTDPWSAKANLAEDQWLSRYLLAKGFNPKYTPLDVKIGHSKSGQFLKWKRDHMNDFRESVDEKDTVTVDIPLLIRLLELAREDIKTDMDLHRVVERLIDIRNKGVLTMDNYDFIANMKESVEETDLTRESYHPRKLVKIVNVKEDKFQDQQAATQTTGMEVESRKSALSKSARMIKSMYKHNNMKEDLNDWEKEDKSVQTYGKKPKMNSSDKDNGNDNAEKNDHARAILSGGTTLTGEKRDTVEIDPMMKNRPGLEPSKNGLKKQENK